MAGEGTIAHGAGLGEGKITNLKSKSVHSASRKYEARAPEQKSRQHQEGYVRP